MTSNFRPTTLRELVTEPKPEGMGLCCVHGYLALLDLRMGTKPEGRLLPSHLTHPTGLSYNACYKTVANWRSGKIKCQGMKDCVLVKAGIKKEQLPSYSPEYLGFLALQGKSFLVDRVKTILEPIGPEPIRGRIVQRSQTDWLWVGVALEYEPATVKLGDQLRLSPDLWGTVTHIDGNIYYLLLPGDKHGQRNKRMEMGGVEPSHMKPTPGVDKS